MLEAVDVSVGRVRTKLKELSLEENTLFVFSSDNGGYAGITISKPLKGAKGALYEGGVRVPTAMVWPAVIEPETVCDTPITSVDFMPTFAEMAGAKLPQNQPVDGKSFTGLLKRLLKNSITPRPGQKVRIGGEGFAGSDIESPYGRQPFWTLALLPLGHGARTALSRHRRQPPK